MESMANLSEIKDLFKKQIEQKNRNYNFFLDNTPNPGQEKPISLKNYDQYLEYL